MANGWTGTQRAIQSYIDNGGAVMDEAAYQKYRLAVLTQWLDRFFVTSFEVMGNNKRKCNLCPSKFDYTDVEGQLDHMKDHKPEWFQGTKQKRGKRP